MKNYYPMFLFLAGAISAFFMYYAQGGWKLVAGMCFSVCFTFIMCRCLFQGDEPCNRCEAGEGFAPSHNGSPMCKSGSIASGGNRAHCSCDVCF